MKHLRTFLALGLVLLLVGAMFTACEKKSTNGNNEEDLVGSWTLTYVTGPFGEEGEQLRVPVALAGISGVAALNEDGTFSITMNFFGDVEEIEGTWSATSSTLTLDVEGDLLVLEYDLDGDTLLLYVEQDLDEDGIIDELIMEFERD